MLVLGIHKQVPILAKNRRFLTRLPRAFVADLQAVLLVEQDHRTLPVALVALLPLKQDLGWQA